ncbi:bis(5'-nucleosidyl)-tetraphosphatase [Duganella sp. 1411]|uniref:NUDIX domain-containing protein n=1 Tax=Duganella sp. 1411 TaxID=2806572 RepID=UPI001B681828|nr:NUDIX domain-containing protein [Duganella sp. 1411]MBP1202066.1 bis(5'-nucleosidyl)-tetraphosphatase [Duganella sp. 1411]
MKHPILSAGMVIRHLGPAGPRYLLLRSYRYWDFPKGEVEPGESAWHAARREVREETSLAALSYPWGRAFRETPPYGRGKVARFYLAAAASDTVRLRANPQLGRAEHHAFRWLPYAGARALLPPRLRAILDWAEATAGGAPAAGA